MEPAIKARKRELQQVQIFATQFEIWRRLLPNALQTNNDSSQITLQKKSPSRLARLHNLVRTDGGLIFQAMQCVPKFGVLFQRIYSLE
jgi:hypothetical protein